MIPFLFDCSFCLQFSGNKYVLFVLQVADSEQDPSVCSALLQERELLQEAALVLGDDDSRQVYLQTTDGSGELDFITNPLNMVNSSKSPWRYMAAIACTLGVMHYLATGDRQRLEHTANRERAQRQEAQRQVEKQQEPKKER